MSLAQLWDKQIAKAQQHRVNEIVISMSSEWQLHLLHAVVSMWRVNAKRLCYILSGKTQSE